MVGTASEGDSPCFYVGGYFGDVPVVHVVFELLMRAGRRVRFGSAGTHDDPVGIALETPWNGFAKPVSFAVW